jgi:hypothetical protein
LLPEGEATPVTRQVLKLMTREIDARRIADALGARIAGRYPGWASQRTFRVDAKARKAIAAALDGVER